MIRKIIAHKRVAFASVAVLGVVMITLAVLAFTNRTGPNLPDPLPPMTLTYEVYGASVSVGNRSIPRFKELRRLEYRSQNDWTETVIESPTLDLGRYGTGSDVGLYMTVKGNAETEYDAMTDTTNTSTLGSGVHLPNGTFGMIYAPVAHPLGPDITGEAVTTNARVCFNGDCADNAAGVKYTKDGRTLVVLEGVGFTLPIQNGDHFTLKSAEIQADRPQ